MRQGGRSRWLGFFGLSAVLGLHRQAGRPLADSLDALPCRVIHTTPSIKLRSTARNMRFASICIQYWFLCF
jgi:hypothetical protein